MYAQESKTGPQPSHYHNTSSVTFGAMPTVPAMDYEPILSRDELEMRFGGPVIHERVDYSRLTKLYRQALLGEEPDEEYRKWDAIPLRELAIDAQSTAFLYAHRLLILREKYYLQNGSSKGFHRWLSGTQGYAQTDRTLRRQVCYARLGLILAASGPIDCLPSQNVACIISNLLPRSRWAEFLQLHPVKECGDAPLKRAILNYCEDYGVPVRSTPILKRQHPSVAGGEIQVSLPPPAGIPSPVMEISEASGIDDGAPRKALSKVIAAKLPELIPAYWLANESATRLAKRIVSGLRAKSRNLPNPKRVKARLDLHSLIEANDAAFAEQIVQAALMRFYDEIEREHCRPTKSKPDDAGD